MATQLTIQDVDHQVQYRQVVAPNYVSGTFVADDTDNHDFRADGRGKGRLTVSVDNPSDKDLTVTVYGAQTATAEVADAATKQIGSFTATNANGAKNYETINDPFPFYLVRLAASVTPDGSTVTLYTNFSAF